MHPHLRADEADPSWPDRDRVLTAPDAPAMDSRLSTALAGPPGLAFAAALGLALGERLLASRFGRSLVDHRTWLIAGPAELAAGPAQEAASIAGALTLGRLTVIASVPASENRALARFTAMGWSVRRVPEGSGAEFEAAISAALRAQKPTLIAALRRPTAPRPTARQLTPSPYGPGARRAWLKRLRRHAASSAFQQTLAGPQAPRLPQAAAESASLSPAETVRESLARLAQAMPDFALLPTTDAIWSGRHHATAGALLGLALHGGLLPAAWFPPNAWSSLLPARQEAAARRLKLLMLIGQGAAPEAEALAAEFRPAGDGEAADCLALALRWPGPAVLSLAETASTLPAPPPAACAQGGYRLAGPEAAAVTLIASGAEIPAALALRENLAASGITAALVSLPCRRLFAVQEAPWRAALLGDGMRIFIGAGGSLAWPGIARPDDMRIDVSAIIDPVAAAARIERRLSRSPAILEQPELLLESAPQFD